MKRCPSAAPQCSSNLDSRPALVSTVERLRLRIIGVRSGRKLSRRERGKKIPDAPRRAGSPFKRRCVVSVGLSRRMRRSHSGMCVRTGARKRVHSQMRALSLHGWKETAIGLVSGSSGAVLSGGSFQRVREFGKEVDGVFLSFFRRPAGRKNGGTIGSLGS